VKLNLGCSDRALPGFIGVDIVPPADQIADLRDRWPWPDSSVDEIAAYDIFEHIECRCCLDGRIHVMNESWRVLRPGGRIIIEVPSASKGAGFAQDPTHKTAWCMNSFQYFEDGSFARGRFQKNYCIRARFRVVSLAEREYRDVHEPVWKITAVLEAVK